MNVNTFYFISPFLMAPFVFLLNMIIFENSIIFNNEINIYLTCMISLITFPVFYGLSKNNLDLFEPSVLFMLGVAMGFLIPAFLLINNPDIKGQYLIDYKINILNLSSGLKYSVLSFSSFLIGYYMLRRNSKLNKTKKANVNSSNFILMFSIFICLYVVSKILSLIVLGEQSSRGLGYEFGFGIFQPFTSLSNFLIIIWLVFFIFSKEIKGNMFLSILMALIILTSFNINSRGGVLAVALAFFGAVNYQYIKLKLWHGFFLLSLALIPILTIGLGRYDIEDTAIDIYINFISVAYLATFAGLESMIIISEQIPEYINFYNGGLLAGAFIYPFFPRIFFPWKPEVYGYNLFWEDYISASTQGQSEYFLSMPGHFYADFGFLGIIIGSFFIGVIYSYIYKLFRANYENLGIKSLYILACVIVFFQTSLVIPTSMTILRGFLLPAVFVYVIYWKKIKI